MKTDWNCLEGGDQLVGDFFVSKFAINCRKHWMQFHLFSKSDDKLTLFTSKLFVRDGAVFGFLN